MTSFQQKIQQAEQLPDPEAEHSMDLRIEIHTHGKPAHLWKLALRLHRHLHVVFGDSVTFMTLKNEELRDEEDNEEQPDQEG